VKMSKKSPSLTLCWNRDLDKGTRQIILIETIIMICQKSSDNNNSSSSKMYWGGKVCL
jgi:hypothetical protein